MTIFLAPKTRWYSRVRLMLGLSRSVLLFAKSAVAARGGLYVGPAARLSGLVEPVYLLGESQPVLKLLTLDIISQKDQAVDAAAGRASLCLIQEPTFESRPWRKNRCLPHSSSSTNAA